jgi:hypothetical protein
MHGPDTYVSELEVVHFEHVDHMPHLRPLVRVRVHAAERHQERPLQRLGRRPLGHLTVHYLLRFPLGHHVLEPLHQVHLHTCMHGSRVTEPLDPDRLKLNTAPTSPAALV